MTAILLAAAMMKLNNQPVNRIPLLHRLMRLEAIAKLGDETALTLARDHYQDENPLVRTAVLKSLTAALKPSPMDSVPMAK